MTSDRRPSPLRNGSAMFPSAAAAAAVIFLLLFFRQSEAATSAGDVAALYSLRSSLNLRARDWPRKTDPCSPWAGVTCRSGRVISLNFSGLRRTRLGRAHPGSSLAGLRNLTLLTVFNSSGFALPGPIPDWLGPALASSLSTLDLRSAAISGPIPYSLGRAAALTALSLAGNSITGDIPPTLSRLSNLASLDLSQNLLTGSIPASLAGLQSLSSLDLSSNFLSGPIPPALGTMPRLKTLILSSNSLSGSVPATLGNLSFLQSLDVSFNSIYGNVPVELQNLRSLQELNLGSNFLVGSLPGSLFSGMSKLRLINLSDNNFSGSLPSSLWLLGLEFVDLSNNNLTGSLPDLLPLNSSSTATAAVFNLSNNLYYGSVSSSIGILLQRFQLVDLSYNYFEGSVVSASKSVNASLESNCFGNESNQRSLSDCEAFYAERGIPYDGSQAPSPLPVGPPPGFFKGKRSQHWKYILAGVLGSVGFIAIVIAVIVLCLMRPGARRVDQGVIGTNSVASEVRPPDFPPDSVISMELSAVGEAFTYEQLVRATSDFSGTNFIKNGHSGELYQGVLDGGFHVVVKRTDAESLRRAGSIGELDLFAKVSHTRLAPFLGQCFEKENEKFLVYKHMPYGDLSNALYRKPRKDEEGLQSLDWITRLKIAIGVAEALCFLHHECNPPLVHRDVQASSILLDDKFEVRLASLSEVCVQEGDSHQNVITRLLRISSTGEQGTSGPHPITWANDVYCFGKVLLELVTGKLGISGSDDATEWLDYTLHYVNIYEKDLVTKIIDPSLIVDEDLLEEVWAMAFLAKSCLHPKPSRRPLARYVLKALENPLAVVREVSRSGSARLRATSSRGSWRGAFLGSWRLSSSDIASPSGPPRGERSSSWRDPSSRRRPSREIFPEPPGERSVQEEYRG